METRKKFPSCCSEPDMRVFRRRYNAIFIEEDYSYRQRRGGFFVKFLFILVSFSLVLGALYLFIQ